MFTNPLDLVVMATREVSRSLFTEWIVEEPKPKDFVVPILTGETPFSMVYGTEAVIPMEIGLPTLRSDIVDRPKVNLN